MTTVSPPDITRPEAQVALVQLMLTDHGRAYASELFIVNRALYRITVEQVPAEEAPEAARRFFQESGHGHD